MTVGILVLEDGNDLRRRGNRQAGTAAGEVVFSTSMTGYQEMLTDPSYAGQLLTSPIPHRKLRISEEDFESRRVQVAASS